MANDSWVEVHAGVPPAVVSSDTRGTQFVAYKFIFQIDQSQHEFSERYSSLLTFHETLQHKGTLQRAFGINSDLRFPPKIWFKDMTRPRNHKKRAEDLLDYFRRLVQEPEILKSRTFQAGIGLDQEMKEKMTEIAVAMKNKLDLLTGLRHSGETKQHTAAADPPKQSTHGRDTGGHSRPQTNTPPATAKQLKQQQKLADYKRQLAHFHAALDNLHESAEQDLQDVFQAPVNVLDESGYDLKETEYRQMLEGFDVFDINLVLPVLEEKTVESQAPPSEVDFERRLAELSDLFVPMPPSETDEIQSFFEEVQREMDDGCSVLHPNDIDRLVVTNFGDVFAQANE